MNIKRVLCALLVLVNCYPIAGQIFVNQASDLGVDAIVESHIFGSGLSTYDFNKDGFDDITLANDGELFFYVNEGGSSFSLYTVTFIGLFDFLNKSRGREVSETFL